MIKLRLWLKFWQQNSAIAMNVVVTSHLPVCLYSAVGGKVNRQGLPHSLNGGPQGPRRWIAGACVIAARWGHRARDNYFNRFSPTSSGKVFSESSASRSLEDFFTDQTRYEKRSSTAKVLLLGVCFVAEDPKEREHLRKIFSRASAEAITYRASTQWQISRRRAEPT
jgi:hypothetical protein